MLGAAGGDSCHASVMERLGRRQLLVEGGRLLALGAGAELALGAPARAASTADDHLRELAEDVRVVIPRGDPRYAKARLPWNARFDAIKPLGVVMPSTPAEVKAVVRWARSNDVRLAVRSGGHSYAGLSSTTGVVVDLSRLSGVQLGPDHVARIGPGARLGKVYERLWAGRRSIPPGRSRASASAGSHSAGVRASHRAHTGSRATGCWRSRSSRRTESYGPAPRARSRTCSGLCVAPEQGASASSRR